MTGGNHSFPRATAVVVAIALTVAACGDDETTDPTIPDGTVATAPTAASPGISAPVDTGAAAAAVPAACPLVPTADVAAATDLAVDGGAPDGNELRQVCTFRDTTNGVGITVGVEAGGRFDDKAEQSRSVLEVDGEEIDDLGDRALFFFSDETIAEGVGGVLVGVGDLTIDITLQGLDEEALRDASTSIAELAVSNL